ncbi:MSC_0622 family F1-like ATPase gamma subunit [Mycoplasma aquilae ATCC BAA-1896]|uniref:MSC_0622 family F1-like ATPase gamma subunit n=1 Tax=Mycoplasma aquilae TaxID=1312741 RepID=UPI003A8862D6
MHIKKIKQKAESLDKILTIVESQKNINLINILRLSQQIGMYCQRANQAKSYIDYLASNYAVANPLIEPVNNHYLTFLSKLTPKNSITYKTIWVYITEEEKYETNSYQKYEKYLLQNFAKNDSIVVIGNRAKTFAQENNLDIIFENNFNDVAYLTDILPDFLEAYLDANGFCKIKFVLNSSKTKQLSLNVIPLSELNFDLDLYHKQSNFMSIEGLNIYPNINGFIKSQLKAYLTYMTLALLSESNLIYQKYSLVAINQKINDLEKKQKRLALEVLRAKRELEVEQISILSKKKDLLHDEKENAHE